MEKTCEKGHRYFKTGDCPTCPICEKLRKPTEGFLSELSAPAIRALENERIDSLEKLATYSEKEILKLHGIGKSAIPKLKEALEQEGLQFRITK